MRKSCQKKGKTARQLIPFAQYCMQHGNKPLAHGASIQESLFVSVGRNGWDLAEPGNYTVQVALHLDGEDIVSKPLHVRVAPPVGYDEEYMAQEFFTDEVGRVLTFDGTQYLTQANDTLREVTERLKGRKVATHAHIALGNAMATEYKQFDFEQGKIIVAKPRIEEAKREFKAALLDDKQVAAESLSRIDYKYYGERFTEFLQSQGDSKEATTVRNEIYQTIENNPRLALVQV